jgi:hypothetical protein
MNKPIVNIVEPQQYSEPQEVNISSAEAYALMAKYGVNPNTPPPAQQRPVDPNANLTFDQMIAIEENKLKAERQQRDFERMREMNKPTPYSFDRGSVRHYDNQYRTFDDETNFGVEVKIVSDMPINNQYYK